MKPRDKSSSARRPLIDILAKFWFYAALLIAAALVNAAGYLLTLWHDETMFDEAVHFYTSFAVVAAIGRAALASNRLRRSGPRWTALLVIGILLGLAWEAFEYMIGIIGSRQDTLMDLAMDLAGALLAAGLVSAVAERIHPRAT